MEKENIGDIRRNKKQSENFILYLIKQYLIYIIMAGAIITMIFFSEFVKEEAHIIEEEIQKLTDKEIKRKHILPIILIVVVILILFILFSVRGSKEFVQTQEKKQIDGSRKSFVKRLTRDEYERSKAEATQKELQKLYENPQFKKLFHERGDDTKKWAWQSREKDKRVVYRENEDSEDIDRLSQITLSDD